jgi:glycosyltransferase involved in cell wall biosynthesis
MMKLLIISYSYPPALTPRAFRWAAIASELARRGHEVHVLCAASGAEGPDKDGVVVHRVGDWLLDGAARVSAGTPSSGAMNGPSWRGWLRRGIRSLWRLLYWPDFACGWLIPATRAARRLAAEHHFNWIITVSLPFTGHLVGLLSVSQARRARWLVDIGDPFHLMREPAPNNAGIYSRLNRSIEARIISSADSVSVTTSSTQQLYAAFFGIHPNRITVIPPLLSLPPLPAPSKRTADAPLRLVFAGTLYSQLRSPNFLISCLSALLEEQPEKPLELHFYGALNDCAAELAACPLTLRGAVIMHGMVDRAQVLQAMADADVLINIGNNSEAQLASKVIEYMAAGKPILNLVSIPQDASLSTFCDYPAVLTLYRDDGLSPTTVALLRDFIFSPPVVPADAVTEVRERFSSSRIAGKYEEILNSFGPRS